MNGIRKMDIQLQESFSPKTPRREEVDFVSLRWAKRVKKQVSWVPGTVDNELEEKKSFDKEFYFSQDIWG